MNIKPDMTGTAWVRRLLVGGGLAMLGFAVFGAGASTLTDSAYLEFVVEITLIVLVLLPLSTFGVGWLIGRLVPVLARPIVQGACIATALIVGIAWPSVLGRGRESILPSALPRDYAAGLWIVLGVIWAAAALSIIVRIARRRIRTGKSLKEKTHE